MKILRRPARLNRFSKSNSIAAAPAVFEALESRLLLDGIPPTVGVVTPLPGEAFPSGRLTATAIAADADGTVERVEFQWSGDGVNWRSSHFYDGATPVPDGTDWFGGNGWALDMNLSETHDDTVWVRAKSYDDEGLDSGWVVMDGPFSVEVPGFFSDEFTGDGIDGDSWNVFDDAPIAGGNRAEAENISVADGIAAFTMINDSDPEHPRRGAQIISRNNEGFTAYHHYGSYRARMRAEEGRGGTTAFFTYLEMPEAGAAGNNLQEIDIEIFGEEPGNAHITVWYSDPSINGETGVGKRITASVAVDTTQWHEYGFDWSASSIKFYVDEVPQDVVLYYYDAQGIKQPVYTDTTTRSGIRGFDFQQAFGIHYLPDAPAPIYLNTWVHEWGDTPPLFTGELQAQFDYVNMSAAVNMLPEVESLSAWFDPLGAGEYLTLTARNVTDIDGTIAGVEFYRDTNGNGILDLDTDGYLGDGVNTDGGDWMWASATYGFNPGENAYFARAQDSAGDWSEAVGRTIVMLTKEDSPFVFVDATTEAVALQYKGSGAAYISFPGSSPNGLDIESVVIAGAKKNSGFYLTANNDSPAPHVTIYGSGFGTLDIDGDLAFLDIAIQQGKRVKNIIVAGALGDVDGTNAGRIDNIRAESIIGDIDAQYIKKLIASGDFDGADVTVSGKKGKISELRAGNDVVDSVFSALKGISKAYIGGDVSNSSFDAYGSKAKLDKFYISGGVTGSEFSADGYKSKLGRFYIGGNVEGTDFTTAGYKGRIGKMYVGYDWNGEMLPGDSHFGGTMTAEKKITRAYVTGAIYGTFCAPRVDKVGSKNDYFRDPDTGEKDSWTEHFCNPGGVKKAFDCDGRLARFQ